MEANKAYRSYRQ